VAAVQVAPAQPTIAIGGTLEFSATLRTANGTAVTGVAVAWRSTNTDVATVTASGRVSALAAGNADIIATAGGREGRTTITVSDPSTPGSTPAAAVTLDVEQVALTEGGTQRLTATARNAEGQVITGRAVQWTSSASDVALVDPSGMITGVRSGTATITARVDGQVATARVDVTADYDFDLAFGVWNGIEGDGAHLYRIDLRAADRPPKAILPGDASDNIVGPSPSPDGARFAFAGRVGGVPGVYVVRRDGSGLRRLLTGSEYGQPTWSPDGAQLALTHAPEFGRSEIVVVDTAGKQAPVSLTAEMGSAGQRSPAWSPQLDDGTSRIAFVHMVAGAPQIWSMRPDGSDKRQLTAGGDDEPAWSPDGRTIAYQHSGSAVFGDLWLVDADGSHPRALLPVPLAGTQWSPAWSPDGRLIAFTSKHEHYGEEGSAYEVYTVWADGSKLARRTSDGAEKYHPMWLRRP
jgi:Tol biopolymer transport system component